MVADLQRKRGDVSKLLAVLSDAVDDGRLPVEDADAAHAVLDSVQFRSWPGKAREMLGAYDAGGVDAVALAGDIRAFGRRIYAEDRAAGSGDDKGGGGAEGGAGGAGRLVLVGAQFVMEEYDSRLGQKGLERHME